MAKVKTTVSLNPELKKQALDKGINMSQYVEQCLTKALVGGDECYNHVLDTIYKESKLDHCRFCDKDIDPDHMVCLTLDEKGRSNVYEDIRKSYDGKEHAKELIEIANAYFPKNKDSKMFLCSECYHASIPDPDTTTDTEHKLIALYVRLSTHRSLTDRKLKCFTVENAKKHIKEVVNRAFVQ